MNNLWLIPWITFWAWMFFASKLQETNIGKYINDAMWFILTITIGIGGAILGTYCVVTEERKLIVVLCGVLPLYAFSLCSPFCIAYYIKKYTHTTKLNGFLNLGMKLSGIIGALLNPLLDASSRIVCILFLLTIGFGALLIVMKVIKILWYMI